MQFLVEEIHRALSFYWRSDAEDPLAVVYLSGGPRVPKASPACSATGSRRRSRLAKPLERVTLGGGVDVNFIRDNASSLAVTVGLASRRPGDES